MSLWYVNIPLSGSDLKLQDYALLEKIRNQCGGCQGYVSPLPYPHGHTYCLSIELEVNGELEEPLDDMVAECLFNMAYDKVQQWMRDLPTSGLPFTRSDCTLKRFEQQWFR